MDNIEKKSNSIDDFVGGHFPEHDLEGTLPQV